MKPLRHALMGAALLPFVLSACATGPSGPSMPFFPPALTPEAVAAADDFLWLEEVQGARALEWVQARNRDAQSRLDADPRFEPFRQQAFAILSAQDRIPMPRFQGGQVTNFWQDERNPKGLWRRTSLDGYRSDRTPWEMILDLDALAREEGRDWVWKGATCLPPDESLCLISLSDGGRDAVEVREFDTRVGRFVPGGFRLPEGKHRFTWADDNTLLVATDFGAVGGQASLTESGYPYIVRALARGQTLDQASEVYRGDIRDGGYGVSPYVLRDPQGVARLVLVNRPLDTFRRETWVIQNGRASHQLALPERSTVRALAFDQVVFTIEEPFAGFDAGALLSWPIDVVLAGGQMPTPELIMQPGARQSIESVAVTRSGLAVNFNEEVVGQLALHGYGTGGWSQIRRFDLPANSAVSIVDTSSSRDQFFVSVQGLLTPQTLLLANAATGESAAVRTTPERFDGSNHVVEQFQARSRDGTLIPYFLVRPRNAPMDGSTPTILFGYGGFQISFPPTYIPQMGRLWLEQGGAYVIANIRGGGEFGPQWHQDALRERRQNSFDDFAAVGRDLIDRGLTSPRRLGIYGRSNGGVLTSVSVTQNPDLFNAVVIESPLVDMMRYHELPAGASWIGEYGDPRIPGDAAFISRYSAYQRLSPDVQYPRIYLTTNTLDDRVHPAHARKFAARLEAMGQDVLYFEDTAGGHSYDADPAANARRWARHYVYLSQQLVD